MGNLLCMGLILGFRSIPSPWALDHADHCLPAGVNMHVLDCHLLLALAAVAVQCIKQYRVGAANRPIKPPRF